MLPKHHYALHLPTMLANFGVLLSTMVNERKHRLVLQYTRDRDNCKSFEVVSLEEICVHQLWEPVLPFFNSFKTSKPQGRIFHALHELFPGIPDRAFTIHRELKIHGGSASDGDVVSFLYNGRVEYGQLKLSVGIHAEVTELYSLVALWESLGHSSDGSLVNFRCLDLCIKVQAHALRTVFTHQFSSSGDSCAILIPWELQ